MTIWIDFINSPQVSFFDLFVEELKSEGHEILFTCRDSGNTVALLKQRGWRYNIIGDSVKKGLIKKILSFPGRIFSLYSFLKKRKIDLAIAQSSFYLPLTAKLLGIPSLYTNDNEHALGNIPSFLFATKIFLPENIVLSTFIKKVITKGKTVCYPGIKEGIYLWKGGRDIQEQRKHYKAAVTTIYVRPEPTTAQYYSGKINFLDSLLLALKDQFSVIVLCRGKEQMQHYQEEKFKGILVPDNTISFREIAESCCLFIGAGGSMTREMALIGIPTISVYQDKLLEVDKLLIRKGLLIHTESLTAEYVKKMIAFDSVEHSNDDLIEEGKQAFYLIRQEILKYNS